MYLYFYLKFIQPFGYPAARV